MRFRNRGISAVVWAGPCLLPLVLAACATHPAARPTAQPLRAALPPGATVLLLAPPVRFENMQTEAALSGEGYDPAPLAGPLRDAARGAATAGGAVVIECEPATADWAPLCAELAAHGFPLSRGTVRPESQGPLTALAARQSGALVLATAGLAREGPGSYYNANTGQIHSASATTVITAALIDAGKRRVVWRNDVMLRAIPGGLDESYREMLQVLFTPASAP